MSFPRFPPALQVADLVQNSSNPDVYTFDRFLPSTRNESLSLVILYAAPTDEGFPALYDLLNKLAQPPAGHPRLQFALRWKINTEAPATTFSGRYDVKAELEGNVEVVEGGSNQLAISNRI